MITWGRYYSNNITDVAKVSQIFKDIYMVVYMQDMQLDRLRIFGS